MSSPSCNVIDPLICSYDAAPNKTSSPRASSSATSKQTISASSTSAALPAPPNLIPPPNQPSTGWTPLVSRTFSADINSYNSTPSSKIFTSLYKQNAGSYNQNNSGVSGNNPDDDYPGLSLTPFLNHNLNLMAHPNSAGHYSNQGGFTPFYDRSMHLTDFFMDSPIRTPSKLETITPSRFSLHHADSAVRQYAEPLLNVASSKKRFESAPKRLSIEPDCGKVAEKPDDDFDDEFVTPSKKKAAYKKPARTPMRSTAADNKLLHTPSVTHPISSPSTVIMSSAVKSPDQESGKENQAPSPTPVKEISEPKINTSEPVMGIFSEKKRTADEPRAARPKKQVTGTSRFQIVLTDVHTLMNSKKKRAENSKKRKKAPAPPPSVVVHSPGLPAALGRASSSQSQMSQSSNSQESAQMVPSSNNQGSAQMVHSLSGSGSAHKLGGKEAVYSGFHEYNTSMNNSRDFSREFSNTSREFSMLNSSTNTTHTNMTSMEHASFELMHGGSVSTPNKFLLDNSFERASPTGRIKHKADKPGEYMAPPKQASHSRIYGAPQFPEPMNMTMSTPQKYMTHPGAGPYLPDTISPSSRESMAFLYQHLHQMQPENPMSEGKRKKR